MKLRRMVRPVKTCDVFAATRAATGGDVHADVKDYLVDLMKAAAYSDISAAGSENDGEGEDCECEDGDDGDGAGEDSMAPGGLGGIDNPGGGIVKDPIFTITPSPMKDVVINTIVICRQAPLLETKWDQTSPFNDLCISARGNVVPAGCVAIACAQVMFYNRTGSTVSVTGKTFDWGLLEEFKYGNAVQSAAAKDEMARFIRRVGDALCINYSGGESGSNITRAEALFQHLKYKGADAAGFLNHFGVARNLIRKQLPFFLRGASPNTNNGHAWVVDGWNEYYTETITNTLDKDGRIIDSEVYTSPTTCLLHCNFGWSGLCDGYYPKNIFDTSKPNSDIDASAGDREHGNAGLESYIFSHDFKFINYAK
ncbi:MAG: C10 family peptidase [Alistipes sp.]|nr:C10 family peptidase [Alistipes sp.]